MGGGIRSTLSRVYKSRLTHPGSDSAAAQLNKNVFVRLALITGSKLMTLFMLGK